MLCTDAVHTRGQAVHGIDLINVSFQCQKLSSTECCKCLVRFIVLFTYFVLSMLPVFYSGKVIVWLSVFRQHLTFEKFDQDELQQEDFRQRAAHWPITSMQACIVGRLLCNMNDVFLLFTSQ